MPYIHGVAVGGVDAAGEHAHGKPLRRAPPALVRERLESFVAKLIDHFQGLFYQELRQAGACRGPWHPRPEHLWCPLQHDVSRGEPARHPVKKEQLHGAVAPAERIGPGVAAAVDQSVEEEPGIGVVSDWHPGLAARNCRMRSSRSATAR